MADPVHEASYATIRRMDSPGRRTLADRVDEARRDLFVGRNRELEIFRRALTSSEPPFAVLVVTGPGGVGKTTLLHQFAHEASRAGNVCMFVNGHTIDPTPAGVLAAIGLDDDAPAPERMVVLIDHWERLHELEDWLFASLAGRLPASALLVVAGRVPPSGPWENEGAWSSLVQHIRLANLDETDAGLLLARRGLPSGIHEQAIRLSHGHPLTLGLIADLGRDDDIEIDRGLDSMPDLVGRLLRVFLAGVPSESHLAALEICSHVRVTTEQLLAAVLGGETARETFAWLRGLSFMETGPEGLVPHDLARDVLDADLFWRNRRQYADLHHRVRQHIIQEMATRRGDDRIRAAFDLFFLHRRSEMGRLLFSWRFGAGVHHREARPQEFDAIEALVERYEGPVSSAIARYWIQRNPDAFRVFIDEQGELIGMFCELLLPGLDAAATEADPIADHIYRFCRANGEMEDGDVVAIGRFWVIEGAYQEVSPAMDVIEAASFLDWVTTPDLYWSFVVGSRPEYWDDRMAYVDMTRRGELDIDLGGRHYVVYAHDWRAFPPEPYLAFMETRELSEPMAVTGGDLPGINEDEFRVAVKLALRDLTRSDRLALNPLVSRPFLYSRDATDPVSALAACLRDAIDGLRSHPRDERLHRVLTRTFVVPALTQEAAAEDLDLPFSTYRRHLAAGIQRIGSILWQLDAEHRAGVTTN